MKCKTCGESMGGVIFGQGLCSSKCAQCYIAKLEAVAERARDMQREIYPREMFEGCDDCEGETCDCDLGVQLCRRLTNALKALEAENAELRQAIFKHDLRYGLEVYDDVAEPDDDNG